jgi:uncharacterized protein YkwD
VSAVVLSIVGFGGGAGLLLAHLVAGPAVVPVVEAVQPPSPSPTPISSSGPTGPTPAVSLASPTTTARPTSSTTRASRSDPSRSAAPTTSARPSLTPTPTARASTGSPTLESAVLSLTNAERAKVGCQPLRSNSPLTKAARRHSQFMADTGRHGHDGIGDGSMQSRIDAVGYRWRGIGENIAWGYRTAAAVMDGWMHSSGHRANILNCAYRDIGIGVDTGGTNWTQDFGTPR